MARPLGSVVGVGGGGGYYFFYLTPVPFFWGGGTELKTVKQKNRNIFVNDYWGSTKTKKKKIKNLRFTE